MSESSDESAVVVAKFHGEFYWYRSDRDLWVLNVDKWRNDFIAAGYDVPDFNSSFRFGFRNVDEKNAPEFLKAMSDFEVAPTLLSIELATRFASANSWWDVSDLFPIMFVDFDRKDVAAFYPSGAQMERYIPDGWTGKFVDFATEFDETRFPKARKFWVRGDSDLLKLLNERGRLT